MKKIFIIFSILLSSMSFGQISDRENNESTYLIGARPIEGNFGFFFAISTNNISDLTNNDWNESGIPIINVKYYFTAKNNYAEI